MNFFYYSEYCHLMYYEAEKSFLDKNNDNNINNKSSVKYRDKYTNYLNELIQNIYRYSVIQSHKCALIFVLIQLILLKLTSQLHWACDDFVSLCILQETR